MPRWEGKKGKGGGKQKKRKEELPSLPPDLEPAASEPPPAARGSAPQRLRLFSGPGQRKDGLSAIL
eukprot:12950584-Alexandrium_andersonii.AAC.1